MSDAMAGGLKALSDDELLRRLSALLGQSRRIEWQRVTHIGEVDARRLRITATRYGWGSESRVTGAMTDAVTES